jgi:nucleoside 2-deoxyribosyltransferase
MDIYFAASIRGGGIDPEICSKLVERLRTHGRVFTERICEDVKHADEFADPDHEIYERDVAWLRSADALVAEVSTPSHGVGYEIAKAEEWGKPILCLYRSNAPKRISAMIGGNRGLLTVRYEDLDEAMKSIDDFLIGVKSGR